MVRALVIHWSEDALARIRDVIERQIPCDVARTTDDAIRLYAEHDYSIVVMAHDPPVHDGIPALSVTQAAAPEALIIVIAKDPEVVAALEQRGNGRVFRFLGRSDEHWQLAGTIAAALRLVRLERQHHELIARLGIEQIKLQKRERLLDVVVRERTRELETAYQRLKVANREALLGLAEAIEAKDAYTKGHCGRVAAYSIALAQVSGYPSAELETLESASFLHDIGKIGVRDAVLLKPGPLDETEWKHMQVHPQVGDQIASQIELLRPMRPAIRNHHERWDGKGYPDAMKGEVIPMAARIVCIADAFDAMVTERPYKPALSLEVSYGFLRKGAGAQFDPKLVELFIQSEIGEQFDL
ncbi:MAG TPA: HD-GYP domain-containing protein [Polyangia bacterium]|jgi:HD-GYP domain-containing protein (c-di-GMP phosphodiesterase class II)|nr:HD-GYP domain-containing protein [Polyangia bacterium]